VLGTVDQPLSGVAPLTFLTSKANSPTMPIKYYPAPEIKKQVDAIASDLELFHVVPQFVFCVRSRGSKAKRTIARIHGLGKIWQGVLNIPPSYTIEVISEIYDKMPEEEKEKTLIHELLHIPGGFSGGFRPHKGYVERKIVEQLYKKLKQTRSSRKSEPCF
jgi:predicted metallopeptidase